MDLNYDGTESPIQGRRPATSVQDVTESVRATVRDAIVGADLSIEAIEGEIDKLRARRDRLTQHRTQMRDWIEEN